MISNIDDPIKGIAYLDRHLSQGSGWPNNIRPHIN